MAKPIKITPVLKGQDAVNFFGKLKSNSSKKINAETLLSIQRDAEKIQAILKN
ncbi:hypothetical protein [Emticicia sp. CRIBPO]|uniref:hypothetical protein n=1 Tax=Emticicia sp. CRIBPO TaxID=2683258 RepID=UPI00141239A3|nr:hypothetical protein [Emticicia sp. CRIBPO]